MNDDLWRRVEAALDRRIDPFSEAGLERELAGDPEAAHEVRRLLARLARLADVAESPAVRNRFARGRGATAAAALLLLSATAGLWLLVGRDPATPSSEVPTELTSISLVVRRESAPPPTVERIVLVPQTVHAWAIEGDTP